MLTHLFSTSDYTNLNSGQDISTSIPSTGMRGFYFQNVTPFVFHVYDDIDNLVAVLSPWQNVIGSITQSTQQLHISSDRNAASVAVANITPAQWNVTVELSINEQPAQVIPLPYANAANTNVSGNMTIDGTPNVTVASGNINTNTLVVNQSTQAVPTQQQSYYGSGADGAFNPVGALTQELNNNLTSSNGFGSQNLNQYTFSPSGVTAGSQGYNPITDINTLLSPNCKVELDATISASSTGNVDVAILVDYANSNNGYLAWISAGTSPAYNIGKDWGNTTFQTVAVTIHNGDTVKNILEYKNDGTLTGTLFVNGVQTAQITATDKSYSGCNFNPALALGPNASSTGTNLSAWDNIYAITNPANQANIQNYSSVNISVGTTVKFANNAEYTTWFVNGDCTIDGTIQTASALPNASSSAQITLFNGNITVSKGGNGGNGGAGGAGLNNTTHPGGTGGTATAYGSGGGGGGGGGQSNTFAETGGGGGGAGNGGNGGGENAGGANGNSGVGSGGAGGANGTDGGTPGQNGSASSGSATLIIIANGNIQINGSIIAVGASGGGGGNATTNKGGSPSGAGGGGGGSGGGSVLLYAAKSVSVSGTININGGNAGTGGTGGNAGSNGANGQAGTIKIYQYNNAIAG